MLFNWLGYSPGLSKILSHSELIPDAALTLTLMRKRYNEIQSQQKKNSDSIEQALNPEFAAYNFSALTATPQTAVAKLRKSVMLMQRA